MNDRADQQRLLDDVLAESSLPDFRAELLGETLRLARRRRRGRQTRRAGGVLAALFFAAWMAWQSYPVKTSAVHSAEKIPAARNCRRVETQPLPAGAVVATGDFAAVKMISSSPAVATIATSRGGFRFINDAQLLALAEPRAALLIRTGPNSEELVFADAAAPETPPKGGPAN